ncbi:MAG TPA: DUF2203 domain-containing protein [Bryobacteraceae bacterium]|jgi:hypothetical protein
MPRFFHLLEAERLLPEVEGILRSLIGLKEDLDRTGGELDVLMTRIAVAGGMLPPRERIGKLRERKEAIARGLRTCLQKLEETGCLLKDADTGLIDFPTLYRGREVYLCWKLGESGIQFWHQVEDGYRGRRPIDSEFLANHSGDS